MKKKRYKKLTAILTAVLLLCSGIPVMAAEVNNGTTYPVSTDAIANWPQGPDTYSETAVLMDADTGAILYNKGMDEKRYPASITKIMTALLALEHSSLDEEVTFTEECLADQTSDSGNLGMKVGEVLTMRQCLMALMIRSANDVATQIAVHVAGSVSAFADMMNQRAQELGCVNTHFVNASGMPDENHYTTAHDMALIFQQAIKNQDFLDIIGTQSFTIEPTNMNPESRVLNTHHALLSAAAPEHYDGCFGGKTGVTEASKNTLVSGAARDGMTLIAVAMRADAGQVCQDHISMFDYGFNNFRKVEVPGGAVTIPKDVQISDLTTTESADGEEVRENYYFGQDYFVGTGTKTEEVAQDTEEPETLTPEVTVEPQNARENETDTADPSNVSQTYKIVIYILAGLIGLTVFVTMISAVRKKNRRKKRRKGRK